MYVQVEGALREEHRLELRAVEGEHREGLAAAAASQRDALAAQRALHGAQRREDATRLKKELAAAEEVLQLEQQQREREQ